jgi:hypothetical protein
MQRARRQTMGQQPQLKQKPAMSLDEQNSSSRSLSRMLAGTMR